MDEAKNLVNMSVAAIFAALFLGAAVGLISVCYMMWTYFSRQDAANQRMDYYANLTAYDNQTVGGADVLSLLSHADDYGVFVIFLDDTSNATVLDNSNSVSLHSQRYVFFDPDGQGGYSTVKQANYANAIPICNNAINAAYTLLGSGSQNMTDLGTSVKNLHGKTKEELIALFTDSSPNGLGSLTTGATDTYSAFKVCLIYANDGTTDVAGIALVRANANVTNFCQQ